jgi:hypothetical protein
MPSSSRSELAEDRIELVGVDADAGVVDLDLDQFAAAPHADQDAAERVYLMALETRFWTRRRNRLRSV